MMGKLEPRWAAVRQAVGPQRRGADRCCRTGCRFRICPVVAGTQRCHPGLKALELASVYLTWGDVPAVAYPEMAALAISGPISRLSTQLADRSGPVVRGATGHQSAT